MAESAVKGLLDSCRSSLLKRNADWNLSLLSCARDARTMCNSALVPLISQSRFVGLVPQEHELGGYPLEPGDVAITRYLSRYVFGTDGEGRATHDHTPWRNKSFGEGTTCVRLREPRVDHGMVSLS